MFMKKFSFTRCIAIAIAIAMLFQVSSFTAFADAAPAEGTQVTLVIQGYTVPSNQPMFYQYGTWWLSTGLNPNDTNVPFQNADIPLGIFTLAGNWSTKGMAPHCISLSVLSTFLSFCWNVSDADQAHVVKITPKDCKNQNTAQAVTSADDNFAIYHFGGVTKGIFYYSYVPLRDSVQVKDNEAYVNFNVVAKVFGLGDPTYDSSTNTVSFNNPEWDIHDIYNNETVPPSVQPGKKIAAAPGDAVATPTPTVTPAPTPMPLVATPTSSKVLVNGTSVAFDAYNIDGSNYFKLRDLAYVLNGTNKQFEVGWDGTNNAISLTSGQAYTPAGGELAVSANPTVKTPTPTTSAIYLDGKQVSFTAYNIDGNNYFKLRDVMQTFNVGVGYDGATNTITLDTSQSYTE